MIWSSPLAKAGLNILEAAVLHVAIFTEGVEQVGGAYHVGHHKLQGIGDASIYMAFGGEVDHSVESVGVEQTFQKVLIYDIAFHEVIVCGLGYVAQVLQITGIGELIQVVDFVLRILGHE